MKKLFSLALMAATPFLSYAQSDNAFVDIGVTDFSFKHAPEFSMAFNHNVGKYFGLGFGGQTWYFARTDASFHTSYSNKSALYADARVYLPLKKSLFFAMLDVGLDLYRDPGTNIESPHNNGFFTGLGIGYAYCFTKRGMGPYVSLRMVNDTYSTRQYDLTTGNRDKVTIADGKAIVAIGFKF